MMFNYKKSLLSVAAATALAVTSVNANYIPLGDSAGADEQWTLFGVSGLKTSGAGAGTSAGTFSIADSTATKAEDLTQDELFEEGMTLSGNAMAKVKVYSPYAQVDVRVDTTDMVFNTTEPVRTMYVTMTEGGAPAFAFSYRASMEGEEMQYSINADGSDAHTITISSEYTYNNPGLGQTIQEIAGIPGSSLSALEDMVDYDFSNNPVDSAYYDQDDHQDTAGAGEYLRVYSYDASTESWLLYDSRNTADANDFTELEKGKAYWAKMNNNTVGGEGGIVLGSSSISAAEYATAGIQDGWNLMAFDNVNPDIRKSATGLLLTMDGAGNITLTDSSGNHSIVVAVDNTDNVATSATINQAIKAGKVNGTIPADFNLRCYPDSTAATGLIMVANKRFFVADTGGVIAGVTTLTGGIPYLVTNPQNPIDASDAIDGAGVVDDLGGDTATEDTATQQIAMSKYGEHAILVEPLVGGTDAASLGAASLHVQSAASDATTNTVHDLGTDASIADVLTSLGLDTDIGGYTANYVGVDTTLSGANDKVLIASTEPFYVRDYTFTRVFEYKVDTTDGTVLIRGTGTDADVAVAAGTADATAAAALIDGNGAVEAAVDPANASNFIIITDATDANEFTVNETTGTAAASSADQLEDATSTADLAKGAVKGVYSLGNLAGAALVNTVASGDAATNLDAQDHDTDTILVSVTTPNGTFTEASATALSSYTLAAAPAVTVAEFTSAVQTQIENWLDTNNISYTSVTVTNADPAVITIVSSEVTDFTITAVDTDGGGAADDTGIPLAASTTIGYPSVNPDLADDLKFNAVYTPDYVLDGPLYTMKETGYTLKAMVTGTTDLTDGTINWDSIDLTRKPSEWLDSQDYNLFSIKETSGYWSYLETDAGANNIAVSNAVISPLVYTYHFNENGTNYSHVSGNVALTVDGLDDYDDRKSAVVNVAIAGSIVELANIAGSDIYNGKMSSYEIETMTAGSNYEVLANIADGLGYNQKSLDVGLTVDLQKPLAPTVDLGDGTAVAISSTSTDAAGYYIYNGLIPEVNPAGATNLLANLSAEEAAAYALCSSTPKLDWDEAAYSLNVIAVDGTGVLGKGNVSDTTTKSYVPMLKDAVRLIDTNAGDSDATILGTIYGTDCTETGAQEVNYGVTLTSETDLQTVKMAYEPLNVSDLTAVPLTLFVNATDGDSSVIAKITYDTAYAGSTVYVQLESTVYSLELPTAAEITAYGDGTDSSDPLDLSDAGTSSAKQTDQSL
jgi:hypothetical protein